jgi:radical SAM protein with 4Fe4S-binding SPASM domain
MPDLSYPEFGQVLADKLHGKRMPLRAMIELTERCNLRCQHCYIGQPAGDAELRRRELTSQQWRGLLDQLADMGTLWLLISGGEPLLRPDFRDIYGYAKSKGFLITLFTNATLLTPALADYLEDWFPLTVDITVYGATRQTYERVTGVSGSYDRCMQGIGLLRQRNILYGLKTVAMTLNAHEMSAMRNMAERLGVEFRYDPIVRPGLVGVNGRRPCDLRLGPDEVVRLEASLPGAAEEWAKLAGEFWHKPPEDGLYNCAAGLRAMHIDAYGEIHLCAMSRVASYDALQGSLQEGWDYFLKDQRFRRFTKDFACRDCEMSILCARCPGFAQAENGDPESVVEYVCQIAHLRAETFLPKKQKRRT